MSKNDPLIADIMLIDPQNKPATVRAIKIPGLLTTEAHALGLYTTRRGVPLSDAIRNSKSNMAPYAKSFAQAIALFVTNVQPYASANFISTVPPREGSTDRMARVMDELDRLDLGSIQVLRDSLSMAADVPDLRG